MLCFVVGTSDHVGTRSGVPARRDAFPSGAWEREKKERL
jgi:hypothetical protein